MDESFAWILNETATHQYWSSKLIYSLLPCIFRSTKSEKMYPSMLSRNSDAEIEPYYCLPIGTMPASMANAGGNASVAWSQPTSPTPPASRFSFGPLSPTHGKYRLTYPKKNDDGQFSQYNGREGDSVQLRKLNCFSPFPSDFSSWKCGIVAVGRIIAVQFGWRTSSKRDPTPETSIKRIPWTSFELV